MGAQKPPNDRDLQQVHAMLAPGVLMRVLGRRARRAASGFARAACVALALLGSITSVSPVAAQTWPQRPVRFIVPFGPGAGVDIGARLIADRLPARWGKPVIVENRPGADGLIAIQAFISAHDDHTLLCSPSGSFTVHPFQYDKLPYTPADLAPIARISNTVIALGIPASMNIATLAELVARVRAEPGAFNAAVVPGITELTFDYFVKTAGLSIQKVPYRDIVQAATDVGEGRLQIYMSSYAILQPQAQAGRIRTLVMSGRRRASMLPDVPTAAEAGFPSLELEGLVGLFGPREMPHDLRARIGADVSMVASDPEITARLASTAQVPNPGGAAELAASVEEQRARVAAMASAVGMKSRQ
jgi:tripartite-type tricarboxylate transporter receptor subunit TctC